uniref:Uncharacterized protein n=1 Tax=Timema shepardi TaxID=629360 RepID=A0A7R9B1Y3_TIMSH|nr:unnamed protein product [Timema shepardi]
MVYNAQGQPSGEAFIQMESKQSAFMTAQNKHHCYMFFGKKQRYIEVFQCSGEDINLVLTRGIPTTPGAVSPAKAAALLSPGGTLMPPPPFGPAATFAQFGHTPIQLIPAAPPLAARHT